MFIITGGGSGIGASLAKALANRNQKVCIVGRRQALLEEVAQVNPNITICTANVATLQGRQTLIKKVAKETTLSGLIHNAGIINPIAPLLTLSEKDWSQFLDTNLNAPLFLTQALWPQLQGSRVLHIGTGAAYFPIQNWGGYCVSKAALAMLTRCWQKESDTVQIASVKPGIVDTPMQELVRGASGMEQEKLDFFLQLKKENRLISSATVAAFLVWLLFDCPSNLYSTQEWDIYDTTHHALWLKPPLSVPPLEP